MLHDAIGQAKGFDLSSIVLLLSIECAIRIWQFISATVANFLLPSGFGQVTLRSRELNRLGLTLPSLVFDHVGDGFLIHSSAATTVPNISTVSVRSWCIQFLC